MFKVSIFSIFLLFVSCSSSKQESPPPKVEKKEDFVRKALIANISKFRYCYQKELDGRVNTLNGVVILDFTITPKGISENIRLKSRERMSNDLKQCLLNVVRVIQFPIPVSGGSVEVTQPFNFFPKKR